MITVVVRPFTAYGEKYERGDLVDSGSFRNEGTLINVGYLRAATPEEYAKATGQTSSFPTDSPVTTTPPQGEAGDDDVDEDDTLDEDIDDDDDDDPVIESTPPPRRHAVPAKKAVKKTAAKKTAKRTRR